MYLTPVILVFDIGGTNIRAAVYDPNIDELGQVVVLDTPSDATGQNCFDVLDHVLFSMKSAQQILIDRLDPAYISVGFPGPIDKDGMLFGAPTLWGDHKSVTVPLKSRIMSEWPNTVVEVTNDVTAAGYAFVTSKSRDFLVINVGSGIGSKLFLDGNPCLGDHSRGGELGHLRVVFGSDALMCDCGKPGHLGAHASGRGILRSAMRRAGKEPEAFNRSCLATTYQACPSYLNNEMLVAAFNEGDEWARAIIADETAHLGHTLAAVHLNSGVETFFIVGGFAASLGEEYRMILCHAAESAMWENGFSWSEGIYLCSTDEQPNLLGAGRMISQKYGLRS